MSDDDQDDEREGRPGTSALRVAGAAAAPDRVGHDMGFRDFSVEPAMAGIPAGAVQRMQELASAGLWPVHPVEEDASIESDAGERVEAVAGNRRRIAEGPSPGGFADAELRRVDAGAGAPPFAPEGDGLEGLAWLILPAAGRLVQPGNDASGKIRIALSPRIVDAILGILTGGVKAPETGVWSAFSAVSDRPGADASLDSPDPGRPPYVRAAPDRVAARPRPDQWRDDELLTLPEAARLFWPDGPLTTTSLRTAVRDGTLEIRTVAGRHMTTPAALRRLGLPRMDGPAEGLSATEAAASLLGRLERRR